MGFPNANGALHLHRLRGVRAQLQVQFFSRAEDPARYVRAAGCDDDRGIFSAACEKSSYVPVAGLLEASRFRLFSVSGL